MIIILSCLLLLSVIYNVVIYLNKSLLKEKEQELNKKEQELKDLKTILSDKIGKFKKIVYECKS